VLIALFFETVYERTFWSSMDSRSFGGRFRLDKRKNQKMGAKKEYAARDSSM
jgi:hypothetical protein